MPEFDPTAPLPSDWDWLNPEWLVLSFTECCAETTAVLGMPFEEAHHWLDEFAGQPSYGMRHCKLRHHLAGIEQARKLWGDPAAAAERLHIIADLKWEGWIEDQPFPRDEMHYKRMGLF
jgi:hypothetical protein